MVFLSMNFLPIFLEIKSQPCLVVGGGEVAARKTALLIRAQAQVVLVAPQLNTTLVKRLEQGEITYRARAFTAADLGGMRIVFAATNDKAVNREVSALAQARGMLVNVADQPALCNFIMPSIVDRSPVQIAVSSGGASPVLARQLRSRLETAVPAAYGELARFVERFRPQSREIIKNAQQRRIFWENVLQGPIAEMVLAGHNTAAEAALNKALQAAEKPKNYGEVYLVGGGPGDPDLLTFRALRLMQQADVVVYDRLVSNAVLDLSRRDAERIYVGKESDRHPVPQGEINQLLVRLAKQGKRVLRLKGGDPFIFGRGGEEIETLMAEGIPFQIVPGITAASGAAAYAGIPLTHRDYAQACVFVAGHLKDGSMNLNWTALAQPHQTVVVYMGLAGLPILCQELINHGLPPNKPAALIQQATTPKQRVFTSDLSHLPGLVEKAEIKPPSLVIIGEVVKLHEKLAWFEPFVE